MFQDFNSRFGMPESARPTPSRLHQAAELVSRYPHLEEPEIMRLARLYRTLSALDVALMVSDDDLAERLERFRRDHRSKIRLPFRQYAPFIVIGTGGLATLLWAMITA